MDYKKIFDDIYKNGVWNDNQADIPLSGPGSSIENATESAKLLDEFILTHKISSIVDLGCGDLTWVSRTEFFNNQDISYCGVDIVSSVIESHKKTYSTDKFPNKKFTDNDITKLVIVESDLVILRDVIFHLYNDDIINIFKNIKNKFRYISVTSCLNEINNDDMNKWYFAERNIHRKPFSINKKYLRSAHESNFNRNLYIYDHDSFYDVGVSTKFKDLLGRIVRYLRRVN